ncbi:MAG: hypothetical protein LBE34_05245 [Flavobacteriaceae bacterium]|nr:hypothetical protein [Flavobacteriaceae bacterium]
MKKRINYLLCFVFTLFLSAMAFGQVVEHNTKIKDGSVSNSASIPSTNAILELESTSKGFLLPRMSNAQRDAIPVKTRNEGSGLSIYNTDTNCLNYWSKKAEVWMSLCGTLPPAVIAIDPAVVCGKITLKTADKKDRLKQGQYLTPEDILYIDVNVGTTGTYDISTVTDNGYYFSATGSFMNTGMVRVALRGTGVPINGYTGANTGDVVSFYLNGKNLGNLCPSYKIPVDKDGTQFTVNCGGGYTAVGNYFIGMPVDPTKNYVDVTVNVTARGNYRISTAVSNGVSFSGSGTFDTEVSNKTVRLYAEGVPTTAGTFTVGTITNTNGTAGTPCNINFTIKGVDYKVDLTKSTHKGEYLKGRALKPDNTITIEVEVLAPGKASFELKSGTIIFSANDVVLNYTDGQVNKQLVTLVNNSGILSATDAKLTFTGTGKYTGTYSIDVASPAVDYIVDCSSISSNGSEVFIPNVTVIGKHFMTAKVNVITPGDYNIRTSMVNGIYFSAKGTFTQVESAKEIKLIAYGTPIRENASVQYILGTNSLSDAKNKCSFNISVSYPTRSFNILVMGDEEYGPAYPSGGAYKLLMNPDNFGPTGLVKTNGINVANYSDKSVTTLAGANKLKAALKNQDIDILLIVQGGAITSDGKAALGEFIDTGGVIIVSNQVNLYIAKVVNEVVEPTYTNFFSIYFNDGSTAIRNDLALGATEFGSMAGKKITNFKTKYSYWADFDSKYYETIIPAATGKVGDALVVKNKNKAFMYIGYGGWMASISGRSTIGPLKATIDGRPEQSIFGGERVDNAQFFLRVMEWAINKSLENRKP